MNGPAPLSPPGHSPDGADRYTAIAVVLHWAIAVAIIGNGFIGWWMRGAIEAQDTQARAIVAFQLHKSIGLTVLALSLLRLVWRLLHRPPSLPSGMPAWQRFAAKATHWTFYALMIGIPLSGWLYVSTQWRGSAPLNVPTLWFGLFEVPHLLGLNDAARGLRTKLAGVTVDAHWVLAWGSAAMLVLHVGAALKHHLVNRDQVLAQMVPGLRTTTAVAPSPLDRRRVATLAGGFTAIGAATAAVVITLIRGPVAGIAATRNGAQDGPVATLVAPRAAEPDGAPSTLTSALPVWTIDPVRSEIAFSGVHAGVPFRGRFARWSAQINFDPAGFEQSHIAAKFETASVTDGFPLHDQTLPLTEWFDSSRYPIARFRLTRMQRVDNDRYDIEGTLTIKGHEMALQPLRLVVAGDRMTISGHFKVDRRVADLGMESDPDAAWVSREIAVEVRVEARRPGA